MIIALILTVVLIAIAAVHLLWAIGYWFPIRDEATLARTVVGVAGQTKMPGAIACALVVVALLFAVMCLWWPPGMLRSLELAAIGAVFAVRGVVAYTGFWRRLTPEEPFATLDRRYYGPLCLLIAVGFWAAI
jgi:hypothetical protein